MTTIVFDGTSIVSDGREVESSTVVSSNAIKIYKVPNGWFAAAGNASDCHSVAEWLQKGSKLEDRPVMKKTKDDVFDTMFVTEAGKVFTFNRQLSCMLPVESPYAIGSGWLIAFTAMKLGKTAKQAVELACELDINTGGTLQIVKVKK